MFVITLECFELVFLKFLKMKVDLSSKYHMLSFLVDCAGHNIAHNYVSVTETREVKHFVPEKDESHIAVIFLNLLIFKDTQIGLS